MFKNGGKQCQEWVTGFIASESIPLGPRETKVFSAKYKSGCDLMSVHIRVYLQLVSAVITYCHYKTNIMLWWMSQYEVSISGAAGDLDLLMHCIYTRNDNVII